MPQHRERERAAAVLGGPLGLVNRAIGAAVVDQDRPVRLGAPPHGLGEREQRRADHRLLVPRREHDEDHAQAARGAPCTAAVSEASSGIMASTTAQHELHELTWG